MNTATRCDGTPLCPSAISVSTTAICDCVRMSPCCVGPLLSASLVSIYYDAICVAVVAGVTISAITTMDWNLYLTSDGVVYRSYMIPSH